MSQPEAGPSQQVPSLLVPEILGFHPQLLLDDVINAANDAISIAVNGADSFITRWADARAETQADDWDGTQDVEQGLVALQTLLEHHTDIAFDFLEAWSLRNIFAVPPDLPIVMPHHRGLDLTATAAREKELLDEMDALRARIEHQRRLRRLYTRALHKSAAQRARSEQRLQRLAFLQSPTLDALADVPAQLTEMHAAVAALAPLDPAALAALTQFQLADPGKRPWETGKSGYVRWAVQQLLSKVPGGAGAAGGGLDMSVRQVGEAQELRQALAVFENSGDSSESEAR